MNVPLARLRATATALPIPPPTIAHATPPPPATNEILKRLPATEQKIKKLTAEPAITPIQLEILEKQAIARQYGTSIENSFEFSATTINATLAASTAARSAIAAFFRILVAASSVPTQDDTETVTDDDSYKATRSPQLN